MTEAAVACRLCGGVRVSPLGVIPDSDFFAGRVLADVMRGGRLWQCGSCRSMFRHPVLSSAHYLDLYANGVAEAWSADPGRQDLAIVREIIARKGSSGRMLDVGCGSGGFLLTLPASVQKFGVEPSIAAGSLAAQLGVAILGRTPEDLPAQARFDVITLIDVIEHVVDPAALLDAIVPHLAPDGYLIVATGDPGNALWRGILRARFWYSHFPEHISFPSAQFFRIWQHHRGLQPPVVIRTRYRRLPLWRRVGSLVAQMAYFLSPSGINCIGRTLQWLRRMPRPRRRCFLAGGPGVFTDHQVVMIQAAQAIRSPAS
jgi:SAM-dependent methyltransferase